MLSTLGTALNAACWTETSALGKPGRRFEAGAFLVLAWDGRRLIGPTIKAIRLVLLDGSLSAELAAEIGLS